MLSTTALYFPDEWLYAWMQWAYVPPNMCTTYSAQQYVQRRLVLLNVALARGYEL